MKKFYQLLCFVSFFLLCSCVHDSEKSSFYVSIEDSGSIVEEKEYFNGEKKKSDWLLIMYMDADNSLDTAIESDFNEAEEGLLNIRNADGSPREGFQSVRVVVLWDGKQINDSRIFELGSDREPSCVGEKTVNIRNVPFIAENDNEMNMSDGKTLSEFIKWVDAHYESDNKILHIADHGSGPGPLKRAMCEDVTSKLSPFSSREFGEALAAAGYGHKKKKFSSLLLDVCLGASLEDAFEFRNYASYMIASPNSTPGDGFDYVGVMKCFKSERNEKDVSVAIGESFKECYARTSTITIPTVTVIDLSKIEACAGAVDELACSIKDVKDSGKKSYHFMRYLRHDEKNSFSLIYKGSINWLFDVGFFAYSVGLDKLSTGEIEKKASAVNECLSEAIVYSWRRAFKDSSGVVYDSVESPSKQPINFYDCLESDGEKLAFCGLTVCGGMATYENDYIYPIMSSWYKDELAFGQRKNGWADMIACWYDVYAP